MNDGLSDSDLRDLEELNRATRRSRGGGDGYDDIDAPVSIDCTEAGRVGVLWPEGKHPFEVTKVERKQSKGGYDEKKGLMKDPTPYMEVELTCIGGDMRGELLSDRLMLAGKGLTRFVIFADAFGLYDKEAKVFNGRLSDFLGQQVWAAVVTEKSEYQGRSRERSVVDFAGYEPINTYPVPGYEEMESGEVLPGQGALSAADLEEEVEEEAVPEPVPAPRPAARRPAAAAAGSPGGKPPWSKENR